jgi:hypothetical protein
MGVKLRSDLDKSMKSKVPGPGTYVDSREKLRQTSPSFGFGSSRRPEIGVQRDNSPGPGSYAIASKIGEATASLSKQY